jgi:hypothetical protein
VIPQDAPKTRVAIAELLSRGLWYTPEEITGYLQIAHRKLISGAACTARLRDMKKPQHGGYNVKSRPRKGSTAWEYRIEQAEQRAA